MINRTVLGGQQNGPLRHLRLSRADECVHCADAGATLTNHWSRDMNPILGIDLGTTNTAAAVLLNDNRVISIEADADESDTAHAGERTKGIPSAVAYGDDSSEPIAAGARAKALARTHPEQVVLASKRLRGKRYVEAAKQGELDRMAATVQPEDGTGRCVLEFGERLIRTEEVEAALLRHVKALAERQTGTFFDAVTLSVPAYFDAIALGATCEAARLAGFHEVRTVPEPVAAALSMDIPITRHPLNVLTVDLGGGTLDVTAACIYRTGPGPDGLHCDVKANTGDPNLGGSDMDDCAVEHVVARLGLSGLGVADAFHLRRAVEAAKIRLSIELVAEVAVELDGCRVAFELTRRELESALRNHRGKDLLQALVVQIEAALEAAAWRQPDVDTVLLVGGPTAMPAVRNAVRSALTRNARVLAQIDGVAAVDPMRAVAHGAAIFGRYGRSHCVNRHPYGYGYVAVQSEAISGEDADLRRRSARVLVPCGTVFPSTPVERPLEVEFFGGPKLVAVEIIQQMPPSQRGEDGEFRFLGTYELAVDTDLFSLDVSMGLSENGELETTLSNRWGAESATFVGVSGMRRLPIQLPTERKVQRPAHYATLHFVPDYQGGMRRWGTALVGKVRDAATRLRHPDPHLEEGLQRLDAAVQAAGAVTDQHGVNELDRSGRALLERAFELRLVSEAERGALRADLERARRACFRIDMPTAETA
jgi:actin-like ATPase involved in cell morphogenesis